MTASDPAPSGRRVSVVVPMLNASERIGPLYDALVRESGAVGDPEFIFVDDGSTDGTWASIKHLVERDPRVRGVRLRGNFGQAGALGAGFSIARGSVVVMMDDDLEIDPAEIGRFVDAVESGAEFASGFRIGTRSALRTAGSRLFNRRVQQWGTIFSDAGCGFNAMTAELAAQLSEEGWRLRLHRFKFRVAQLTGAIVDVPVVVRVTPGSNYSLTELMASWIDIESEFGPRSDAELAAAMVVVPSAVSLFVGAVSATARPPRPWGIGLSFLGLLAVGQCARAFRLQVRTRREMNVAEAWVIGEVAGESAHPENQSPTGPATEGETA